MLRIALLGAGRIGQVHARSITEHGDAQLAWVCDPIEMAATTLAGTYAQGSGIGPGGGTDPVGESSGFKGDPSLHGMQR